MKLIILLMSLSLISTQAFGFSKNMQHYKVTFNQKRKVSELAELIEYLNLSQESKKFYQSIVKEYSNAELPMIEFNGPNLIFKYQNQESIGEINLDKEMLLIGNNKISLESNSNSVELYSKIIDTISEKEGDAFLMFITSESRNKTSLLNSKLQALFWSVSTEFAKSKYHNQNSVKRYIASEKDK
jgi:hypothetical protein